MSGSNHPTNTGGDTPGNSPGDWGGVPGPGGEFWPERGRRHSAAARRRAGIDALVDACLDGELDESGRNRLEAMQRRDAALDADVQSLRRAVRALDDEESAQTRDLTAGVMARLAASGGPGTGATPEDALLAMPSAGAGLGAGMILAEAEAPAGDVMGSSAAAMAAATMHAPDDAAVSRPARRRRARTPSAMFSAALVLALAGVVTLLAVTRDDAATRLAAAHRMAPGAEAVSSPTKGGEAGAPSAPAGSGAVAGTLAGESERRGFDTRLRLGPSAQPAPMNWAADEQSLARAPGAATPATVLADLLRGVFAWGDRRQSVPMTPLTPARPAAPAQGGPESEADAPARDGPAFDERLWRVRPLPEPEELREE